MTTALVITRFAAVGAALVAFAGVATLPVAAEASTASPSVVYTVADSRIDEASGLGVGVTSPGIDYVENDSGDINRFFALNARTGATAAVVTVPHAVNVDWEDLAVAPDAAGTSSVWLGDIGDNDAVRDSVTVYRVDEPTIAPSDNDRAITATKPDVWHLRYPSGPVNAESLAVTPRGIAYIITKSVIGDSIVYRVPPTPDADHVQKLIKVGSIQFSAQNTGTPEGGIGTLTATSASVSRNGELLAVRTYSDAYVWHLHGGGGFGAAVGRTPTHIALPVQRQGEGIAFHGSTLLLDSEGVGQPVWRVPLPATLARAATAAGRPAATATNRPTAATGSARGYPARRDGRPTAQGRAAVRLVSDKQLSGPPAGMIAAVAAAGVVLCITVGLVILAVVRRRRSGTDPAGAAT